MEWFGGKRDDETKQKKTFHSGCIASEEKKARQQKKKPSSLERKEYRRKKKQTHSNGVIVVNNFPVMTCDFAFIPFAVAVACKPHAHTHSAREHFLHVHISIFLHPTRQNWVELKKKSPAKQQSNPYDRVVFHTCHGFFLCYSVFAHSFCIKKQQQMRAKCRKRWKGTELTRLRTTHTQTVV